MANDSETFFSQKQLKDMKESVNKPKQILLDNVKMDGSINYHSNGNINIYPCPWEDDKQVTSGKRVHYRAGVAVDADGRACVKRYNDGENGPKHDLLYETAHASVKMTRPTWRKDRPGRREWSKESVYVSFKFPKKYGATLTRMFFEQEAAEVLAFMNTRKEETIWR